NVTQPRMRRSRREGGMALVTVMLFLLLALSTTTTFVYRSVSDALIASNRDQSAQAESLARGGIRLAHAVLAQDRLDEMPTDFRVEARDDGWMKLGALPIQTDDGGTLRVTIEDAGARLNLNSLFADGAPRDPLSEVMLVAFFEEVLDAHDADRPDRDPEELAQNLIDWIDADEVRVLGGFEDDYYQAQEPGYRAANRPLLSVDELALVEGFDAGLVALLRPYVSVHPWAAADGINPNTAPPWVLRMLFHGTGDDYQFAEEDVIRAILDVREGGGILCADEANHEVCTPLREVIGGEVYPPPTLTTDIFTVTAEARYGDVVAHVESTVDRSDPTRPTTLSWRVH
ncbi:MAG: type II secretion system minor pseudopilin GspK, partial [Myxococcota bacterium]